MGAIGGLVGSVFGAVSASRQQDKAREAAARAEDQRLALIKQSKEEALGILGGREQELRDKLKKDLGFTDEEMNNMIAALKETAAKAQESITAQNIRQQQLGGILAGGTLPALTQQARLQTAQQASAQERNIRTQDILLQRQREDALNQQINALIGAQGNVAVGAGAQGLGVAGSSAEFESQLALANAQNLQNLLGQSGQVLGQILANKQEQKSPSGFDFSRSAGSR